MNVAPLSILWVSLRNRLRRQARDPRYLLGALLTTAYFGWLGTQQMRRSGTQTGASEGLVVGSALLLLIAVAVPWWRGSERLRVTPAECQWLVTAPLTGRDILLYRLCSSQARILLSALVLSGLSGVSSWSLLLLHFVAIAAALNLLELHRFVAAVVRSWQAEGKQSATIAVWGARGVFAAIGIILLVSLWSALSNAPSLSPSLAAQSLSAAFRTGLLEHVLWPVLQVVRAAFSTDAASWARSMAFIVAAGLLHVVCLVKIPILWRTQSTAPRRRARSQSASSSITQTRDTSLTARFCGTPSAGRLQWLDHPAVAIIWKNLRTAHRTQRLIPQIALVIGAPVAIAFTALKPLQPATEFASGMLAMWAGLLIIAGPLFIRCDLRLDLPKFRLLRTFPMSANALCAAEVFASAAILSGLQLVLLYLSALSLSFNPVVNIPATLEWTIIIAMTLVIPGLNLAQVAAHSVIALVWPQWSQLGVMNREQSTGVGRFYVAVLVSIVIFVVLSIAPLFAGLAAGSVLLPLTGSVIASVTGGIVAGGVACLESVLLVRLTARALDTFNVNQLPAVMAGA